jgi:hypothetical protein
MFGQSGCRTGPSRIESHCFVFFLCLSCVHRRCRGIWFSGGIGGSRFPSVFAEFPYNSRTIPGKFPRSSQNSLSPLWRSLTNWVPEPCHRSSCAFGIAPEPSCDPSMAESEGTQESAAYVPEYVPGTYPSCVPTKTLVFYAIRRYLQKSIPIVATGR